MKIKKVLLAALLVAVLMILAAGTSFAGGRGSRGRGGDGWGGGYGRGYGGGYGRGACFFGSVVKILSTLITVSTMGCLTCVSGGSCISGSVSAMPVAIVENVAIVPTATLLISRLADCLKLFIVDDCFDCSSIMMLSSEKVAVGSSKKLVGGGVGRFTLTRMVS